MFLVNEPSGMLNQLKARARALKTEVFAVYIAARDPRTPWYAKALIFLIVAYTLSPIDLIPDFVPILGYVDDLILVPGGIWLALRLIPPEVMEAARATAAIRGMDGSIARLGAVLIILVWIVAVLGAVYLFLHFTKRI